MGFDHLSSADNPLLPGLIILAAYNWEGDESFSSNSETSAPTNRLLCLCFWLIKLRMNKHGNKQALPLFSRQLTSVILTKLGFAVSIKTKIQKNRIIRYSFVRDRFIFLFLAFFFHSRVRMLKPENQWQEKKKYPEKTAWDNAHEHPLPLTPIANKHCYIVGSLIKNSKTDPTWCLSNNGCDKHNSQIVLPQFFTEKEAETSDGDWENAGTCCSYTNQKMLCILHRWGVGRRAGGLLLEQVHLSG